MFKRVIKLSGATCVRKGRRILARLRPDKRLAEATGILDSSQALLEAKVAAHQAAVDAYQAAQGERDTAGRGLVDTLREFGFIALSCTRNRHDADPYLKYFPDGYGDALRLGPDAISDFVLAVRTKLAEEQEPKILAYGERIEAAYEAFTRAEAAFETAARVRKETFQLVAVEKRNWARALEHSRSSAMATCYFEPAYIREIYRAAAQRRRNGGAEEPEEPEEPEVPEEPAGPGAPEAPAVPPAPEAPAAPEPPASSLGEAA